MVRDYEALDRYLAERAALPFAWGMKANDCASHAAGAINAMTGANPLSGLRWSSETGALKLVARAGGLTQLVDARLTRIAPALAQRGDLAGVEGDYVGGVALLVVTGQHLIGPGGMILSREAMTMAWSAA